MADLLERIVRDWLGATRWRSREDEAEQMRLRRAAARWFGRLHGGNPRRAEHARSAVRARLAERRGR